MRILQTLIAFVFLTNLAARADAFGEVGHKTVAAIAFRNLQPAERTKIVEILKLHPRFQEDFLDEMPDEIESASLDVQQEWFFQQAAIWPDMVRSGPGNVYHQPKWHFINLPLYLTAADQTALAGHLAVNMKFDPPSAEHDDMNAVQTIGLARRALTRSGDGADKARLLAWLFHLVGDSHQPLHSVAMFSVKRFPRGDKGGNAVATQQRGNLHALWDKFPGSQSGFKPIHDRSVDAVGSTDLAPIGVAAAATLDVKTWIDESHDLAEHLVYDVEVRRYLTAFEGSSDPDHFAKLKLSDQYLRAGGKATEKRLVQAGYRLGAILKEIAK